MALVYCYHKNLTCLIKILISLNTLVLCISEANRDLFVTSENVILIIL
jgi:hypothetical protein